MSIEKLEKQVEDLMEKRDELEEKCDTLPQCQEDDGCASCEVYAKIEKIDEKIEELEDTIESLIPEED